MKTAILAGATGLIGADVLELLLSDESYEHVIALSRKKLPHSHPKLKNLVIDFDRLQQHSSQLKGDDVFCCLGTTMKQAGSKESFRKVDLEYPVSLATITKALGARQFLLVTASGANKNSIIFYNRVKGEVQEQIGIIDFEAFHIFQPSLLVGPRLEKRAGENIVQTVMKVFGFFIPKKNKAIESVKVARAMIAIAKLNEKGKFIHHSGELQGF